MSSKQIPYKYFNHNLGPFITVCAMMLLVSTTHAQSCQSLAGQWINQDSSILEFTTDDGVLQGFYQSNASDDARRFPLHGVINSAGEMVTLAFMVSWYEYGSITSWTGYCIDGEEPEIHTMWHLVRPYVTYDWERFVTNTSTFVPLVVDKE